MFYTKKRCVEKYVHVDDDWCPNFNDNTVLVKLTQFANYTKFYVSGMDDTAVSMESFDELCIAYDSWLENIYNKIPDVVNMKWFLEHGFCRE